jgi:hypothetical protein
LLGAADDWPPPEAVWTSLRDDLVQPPETTRSRRKFRIDFASRADRTPLATSREQASHRPVETLGGAGQTPAAALGYSG